jgi:hypothetical protein
MPKRSELPIYFFESPYHGETFEKCPFLLKFKEGDNFNHRNTWRISRIKI